MAPVITNRHGDAFYLDGQVQLFEEQFSKDSFPAFLKYQLAGDDGVIWERLNSDNVRADVTTRTTWARIPWIELSPTQQKKVIRHYNDIFTAEAEAEADRIRKEKQNDRVRVFRKKKEKTEDPHPPILEATAEPVLNPSGNLLDQVALALTASIAESNRIHSKGTADAKAIAAKGTAEAKAMAAKGIEMAGKGIAMATEGIEKAERADAKAEKLFGEVKTEVEQLKSEVQEVQQSAVKAVKSTKKEANKQSKAFFTGRKLFPDVSSDSSQASSPASSKDSTSTPTSLASSTEEDDIAAAFVGSPQAVESAGKFVFDDDDQDETKVADHHQLAPLKEEDEDETKVTAPPEETKEVAAPPEEERNVGMVKKIIQKLLPKP